ncbi:Mannan endo-1,6-alpha-mannosidase DCW1 [Neolecta irregularis DAH-3]|uniref:Mannan endo-1,6-alpha-mannosidase n=1 Tax=Neolecta irregularis (strain DAH-3) TaxID=1198029 RepID=A0A1U7LRM5_NEOID|nr:Mannan endo-1,6-alpha-mannosidase DCW1 [Neolecta irregularis DAH-3]|eukprot:OLL25233.1 Mannan endo-1,6-alpha-mannosidase DCW1 [Neolecta irregularis DAH-3]
MYSLLLLILSYTATLNALNIDPSSRESIVEASGIVGQKMFSFYKGDEPGHVPGLFEGSGSHWWQTGAMFGALIDYRRYTNDTRYDASVTKGMLHQVGGNNNYLPANQTFVAGNDDIAFWAFAALGAAESKFPDPPAGQPQWLALAQAVFNDMTTRWTNKCGGGIPWQTFSFNSGFQYKNSISNGAFFNIAARLARYTGDSHYAKWAEKIFDWMTTVGYITEHYWVLDGADERQNCKMIDDRQWSYNSAVMLGGSAFMYAYTNGSDIWKQRVDGFIDAASYIFVENGVIDEYTCWLATVPCNDDQVTFKGYLARFMGYTAYLVPHTAPQIFSLLASTAVAAGKTCTNMCGFDWRNSTFDGRTSVQVQLANFEVIQSNLMKFMPPLGDGSNDVFVTASSGGTSKGDPNAGASSKSGIPSPEQIRDNTTADKVGAGILSLLTVAAVLVLNIWIV